MTVFPVIDDVFIDIEVTWSAVHRVPVTIYVPFALKTRFDVSFRVMTPPKPPELYGYPFEKKFVEEILRGVVKILEVETTVFD